MRASKTLMLAALGAAAAHAFAAEDWRVLPLLVGGAIDPAWKHVGWGGFVADGGAARTELDPRGMGLLVYTREKFGDCEIRIVYRSEKADANSGVYVRIGDGILGKIGEKTHGVERDKNGKLSPEMAARMKEASEKQLGAWYAVHRGYEVQINDAGDAMHRTGAIYSLAPAAALPEKARHEWRTMIVTLDGERVRVQVDGKPVSHFDAASPDLPPRKAWSEPIREIRRPAHGYIGLQNHDPGDVVWFREVAVRKLR